MILLYMYHKMKHISIHACEKSKMMLKIFCFWSYTCILQIGVDVMVQDKGLLWLVPGSTPLQRIKIFYSYWFPCHVL